MAALLLAGLSITMARSTWVGGSNGNDPSGDNRESPRDDTPGLADALDRASASGDTVHLERRTYHVREGLTVPTGVTIDGQGAVLVFAGKGKAALALETRSQVLNLDLKSDGTVRSLVSVSENARHVTIKGSNFRGTGATYSGLITEDGVADLKIEDTNISDVMHGIRLDHGPRKVNLDNIRIERWQTRGVYIPGTPKNSAENVTMSGLIVEPNVGSGDSRYPIVAVSNGRRHRDITVENSVVRGRDTAHEDRDRPGTADQISISKTDGVTIRRNISIDSGERGINVTKSTEVLVAGNTVERADAVGIGIGAMRRGARGVQEVVVRDNTVINSGRSRAGNTPIESKTGIRIFRVYGGAITKNTIIAEDADRRDTFGLTVDLRSDISISNNTFVGVFQQEMLQTR